MKLPPRVLAMMREHPEYLPLEPLHGWRSAPDDNGYTRCWGCQQPMYIGERCVAKYLEYISITFCPACVADNREVFREWIAAGPTG